MQRTKQTPAGFSLIELMVAVAVVGILAAIAIPSYGAYVVRANRTAAQAQMMDIANREQEYFTANRSYADLSTLGVTLTSEVAKYYDGAVTVESTPIPRFTITFIPKGGQSSDGAIALTSEGVKTPASKWAR